MYTIAILNIALLLIYLLNRFLKQFIELRKLKRKIYSGGFSYIVADFLKEILYILIRYLTTRKGSPVDVKILIGTSIPINGGKRKDVL